MQGNVIVGHGISVGLREELGMRDSEKLVGSVESHSGWNWCTYKD